MKTKKLTIGLVLMLFCTSLFAQNKDVDEQGYFKNVIHVKLNGAAVKSLEAVHNQKANTLNTIEANKLGYVVTQIQALDAVNKQYNAVKYTRIFRYAGKFEEKHKEFGLNQWYEITFNSKAGVQELVKSYKALPEVENSNAVPEAQMIGEPTKNEKITTTNDPKFSQQWHYENTGQNGGTPGADISLLDAWKIETGNSNVIVCIEDGGTDFNHQDISGNMWKNPGETPGNGIDDDNNGFVDDYYGYNFVDNKGTIVPVEHGTHVSGTVAAETNNSTGVSGIAGGSGNNDGVRIMSCQIFNAAGGGGFAEAYVYAADNGAVISQNSWGYTVAGTFDQAVFDGIDYFIANAGGSGQAMQGGIVIFAAGNDGTDKQWYPGYYSPTLSVAATNNKDKKSYYSNYGTWVDIAAPGGETTLGSAGGVISTVLNNGYGSMQGTSMACPHVSGVAALVVSKNYGKITAQQLWSKLVDNTDPIDNLNSSYAGKLGSGRLNAYKALFTEGGDDEAPTAPRNLKAGNITSTSVSLTWDASTDNVGIDHYAIFNGGQEIGTVTNTSYNATGLTSATVYSFTVKAYDAAGNISAASNTETVTTLPEVGEYCASGSTIFSEEWISNLEIDRQTYPSGKSSYSDFTSTSIDFSVAGEKNIAITPSFARNAYNEFFVIWIDFNKDGDFEDDGEKVFNQSGNSTVSGVITIPERLKGQSRMRVSMRYNREPLSCGTFDYGEVEDYTVNFSEIDTEAPTAPRSLTASNIQKTSVDLTWNASTDNVGVDHYAVYQNGSQITTTSNTAYPVPGLTPATSYAFTVKAFDAAGNASVASNTANVTTLPDAVNYCASKGSNSSYFWIQYVSLGSIVNFSGNNNGYADFTSKSTNLAPGSAQTIYLQAGYSTATYYTVYWTVWIDYNQNGTFESGELIVSGSAATSNLIWGSFTVPSDAKAGQTRMRISMKYSAAAGPCETFTYGEVEDYTINISNQSSSAITTKDVKDAIEIGTTEIHDIKLSPIPTNDVLNIEFNSIPKSSVNVISSTGAIVKTFNASNEFFELNVSDLASGVYFIQFNNGLAIKSEKFIKQ